MYFSDFTRRPINSSSPEGENTNQLDTFTELKRHINGLNKVSPNTSWKKIFSLSENILTSQSKDFRSVCYYASAATHIHGLKGLVDGLSAVHDLTLVYWYSAYPEYSKEKARIGAFEWMIEHTTKQQKKISVNTDDLVLIEIGHRLTLKIEEELKSHYGIKAPSFGPIRRIFSQWIEELKDEQIAAKLKIKKSSPYNSETEEKIDVMAETNIKSLPEKQTNLEISANEIEPKISYKKPSIIIILMIIFLIYFSSKQYPSQLKTFENANFDEFSTLVQALPHSSKKTQLVLKDVVLNKSTSFFNNWSVDPLKINKLDSLIAILNALEGTYPDSVKYQTLKHDFNIERNTLINSYKDIKLQFNRARTIIANAQLTSPTPSVTTSYKFSNTLFPLLGRIEYAENTMLENDITKAQFILNAYQLRINTLTSKLPILPIL